MNKALKKMRSYISYFFALFTQAKAFCDNPIIGNRTLNRMGLHVIRVVVAHGIIRFRQLVVSIILGNKVSTHDKQHYLKYGYILKHNVLKTTTLDGLRNEFEAQSDNFSTERQGDTHTRSQLLTRNDIAALPATAIATQTPSLIALLQFASGYFLHPWFYYLRIMHKPITPPANNTDALQDPQKNAHADAFHPTMKAWLFIDDVAIENGPFNYYAGSHKLSWKRLKWEYYRSVHFQEHLDGYSERGSFRPSDYEKKQLGITNLKAFVVPKNTLVIANTYGFHFRGQGEPGSVRDALWMSSWRAPFVPLPLPNTASLNRLLEKQMVKFIRRRSS